MRSSDCGARGRGTMLSRAPLRQRAVRRRLGAVAAPVQSANASRGQLHDRRVIAVADRDQRRRAGPNRARVKRAHIVDVHRRERRFAADRRMAVRVRAVHQPQERAIGDAHPACRASASGGAAAAGARVRSPPRGAPGARRCPRGASRARCGEAAEDGDAGRPSRPNRCRCRTARRAARAPRASRSRSDRRCPRRACRR